MVKDGILYKRYDVKKGRTAPSGFIPAQEPDPVTGHWPGWVAVGNGPDDKWHREAFARHIGPFEDGTYELCGPSVQRNLEGFPTHVLLRHGITQVNNAPRTFDGLKEFFTAHNIEGIVWHHSDGSMVKIKAKDFGIKRG